MNCYVESGIAILNDTTRNLKNLNELGIYLAKQTNIDALKTLKLLILASENGLLNKSFNINSVKTYTEIFMRDKLKRNETVSFNLSMNPQNFGLEIFEYILKNYRINLDIQPYGSSYTLFDFWIRSFVRIEDNCDAFYRRYDMIDKKIDIISYMIKNGLLNIEQIDYLLTVFEMCIQRKYSYTNEQILKMQMIFNVSNLISQNLITINGSTQDVIKQLLPTDSDIDAPADRKKVAYNELKKYEIENAQCAYILQTIPKLVKKRIIK